MLMSYSIQYDSMTNDESVVLCVESPHVDCYFCVAGSVVSYVIPYKFRCCLCRQEIKQLGTEPMC